MLRDEKCRKCGGLLFKVVPLPPEGKYWAMCDETLLDLKSDGLDYFFECPHCKARNITVEEHPEGGPPQFRIFSWK
jgi:phage FluMu protein Com